MLMTKFKTTMHKKGIREVDLPSLELDNFVYFVYVNPARILQ